MYCSINLPCCIKPSFCNPKCLLWQIWLFAFSALKCTTNSTIYIYQNGVRWHRLFIGKINTVPAKGIRSINFNDSEQIIVYRCWLVIAKPVSYDLHHFPTHQISQWPSCPVNGAISEETTPLRTETFHHAIKKNFVLTLGENDSK